MPTAVICPRLPPESGGIGDYTVQLWQRWSHPPPNWAFIVGDGATGTRVSDARSLEAALGGHTRVLLQFTPFGYQHDGVPRWLVDGLRRWKETEGWLAVMFHEVHSPPKLVGRSLWRAPRQKGVIEELGAIADKSLTSTPWFRQQLRGIGVEATICPVPSNVPPAPFRERHGPELSAVVFGLPDKRAQALRAHRQLVRELHAKHLLERLIIVGRSDSRPSGMNYIPSGLRTQLTENLGELTPTDVAEALAGSDLLLSPHPTRDLRKSGSVAAALMNRCALVVVGPRGEVPAFYYSGTRRSARSLVDCISRARLSQTQAAGKRWYDENASWDRCLSVWREAAAFGPS